MNEYNDLLDKISEYEEIAILPDTIAIGKVIKIRVCGNIDENEEEVNTLRNGSLHPVMEYDLQDHV